MRSAWVEHHDADDSDFIVADTRGVGEAVRKVFECYLGDDDNPRKMTYATHLIRKAGVPIKTFAARLQVPIFSFRVLRRFVLFLMRLAAR